MKLLQTFEEFRDKLKDISAPGRIYTLRGSSPALFLALFAQSGGDKKFLAVLPTEEEASKLKKDAEFFMSLLGSSLREVFFLPEPDGAELAGRRAELPYEINKGRVPHVAASRNALLSPMWQPSGMEHHIINLKEKGSFPREEIESRLLALGYKPVPIVAAHGEFRLKSWILDIFPSTENEPVRVEFFGDEIERLRNFDLESQLVTRDIPSVMVLPAGPPPSEMAPEHLGFSNHYKFFSVEDGSHEAFEFVPEDALVLSRAPIKGEGTDAGVLPLAGYGILHNERRDITELGGAIKRLRSLGDVLFVLNSFSQAERIKDILTEEGLVLPVLRAEETGSYPGNMCITVGPLSAGFQLHGLFVITGRELFGEKPAWKPMKKSRLSGLLQGLDDLSQSDYVVHKEHGIGRFLGFMKETVDGHATDLAVIEYRGGSKIYLPLYGIDKITKYKSPEGHKPELDALGGRNWERRKERVKKRLKEMAGKLLQIYAQREVMTGFAASPDTELHREFDSFFPYEETPDQLKAIYEVKKDMESGKPMERLLCGDVGYGKTEVAMRAAFKAVYDHKQVVVLVPTTLLCEQHWRTFSARFAAFPVKIDYISRFKTLKEKKASFDSFERHETDILIGTHAILKAPLSYRDLGLLIVDEEHRFGVAHKERIKEIRKNVDVLYLTATPIPRTLQMALSGIRDMSVIETPPEDRLAVKSVVSAFNKALIKDSIEKELQREGQVFFVHNRIEDMEKLAVVIRELTPQARLGIAHGRVHERELEKTMVRFLDGELDVLLSTAIIGSGLDIPTANTLIVDRADMMGLADLYQLRGRVGRGNVRAYAYFLIPGYDIITDEARKRLTALEELSYLGAGFRVAMKDLEIRGAGNLLGAEQSGYINDIGFDLYLELLEKAVAELKGEEVKERVMPSVELQLDALLPDSYIEDIALRLSFYRRVAGAETEDELENIAREMRERFGPLPEEARNLLLIMSLRLVSERAMVSRIRQINGPSEGRGKVRFEFRPEAQISPEGLARAFEGSLRFIPGGMGFDIRLEGGDVLTGILRVLGHLTGKEDFVIF
jgi:transcription-repair coupling factor (superfamily II helicase)